MVEGGFTGYNFAARVKVKLEEDLQRVFLNKIFFSNKMFCVSFYIHDLRSIIHFVLYE